MRVAPIDLDFAGWTEVPEGEANAWGVIDDDGLLIVARRTREAAESKMAALAGGDA